MAKLSTSDWVQVVTTFAIVASIGLVLFEIRQGREVAQAQLVSDEYALQASLLHTTIGEDFAAALVKACDQPLELTRLETEVMEAWIAAKLAEIHRHRRISTQTGFYDEYLEWESSVRGALGAVLGTAYGRHSWKSGRQGFESNPEILEIADDILSSSSGGCDWYTVYSSYISSEKTKLSGEGVTQ
jgi:hypothetical protein